MHVTLGVDVGKASSQVQHQIHEGSEGQGNPRNPLSDDVLKRHPCLWQGLINLDRRAVRERGTKESVGNKHRAGRGAHSLHVNGKKQ